MNETIEQILGDEFLWTVITTSLSGRRKLSRKGFLNVDCPMCVSRGETADHRGRCGLVQNHPGVGINCYNCGFKTRWLPGDLLTRSMRDFLCMIGVSEYDVSKINYKCFAYRNALQGMPQEATIALGREIFKPSFKTGQLPNGAETLLSWAEKGCDDPKFLKAAEYIYSRGDHIAESRNYYWTPVASTRAMNDRVIIPFLHRGNIVGFSARSFDPNNSRKYVMESPENYLFNCDVMEKPDRKFIIVVEGVLDAVAIDGVAMLGASLNDKQVAWLKSFGKQIVLLPDRDKRGMESIDLAVKNDWAVSFPSLRSGTAAMNYWDDDIKDAAAAVKRHGRLWTVHSIIESSTNKKMEISVKRGLML